MARFTSVRTGFLYFFMFYIAESDGKVHGTHPKLKKAYTNNI